MDLPVVFDLDAAVRGEPPHRLGRHVRRAGRHRAADGDRRRRPLVRDRPVLRVPPAQRLRRGVEGGLRRRPPRLAVAASRWTTSSRRTCTAGRSIWTSGAVTETPLDDVSARLPARRRPRRRSAPPLRLGGRAARRRREAGSTTPASSSSTTWRPVGRERYDLGPPAHPGEFVFVRRRPTPAARTTAGRWVWCTTTTTDRSDLVILDASDATAEPVARVHLPRRVPYGFHGSWISDAELA